MNKNDIYINGKIQQITIREDKYYNTITYTVNGANLPSEIAFEYLKEFQNYPNYKMEKYTHCKNPNITIRSYTLVEE